MAGQLHRRPGRSVCSNTMAGLSRAGRTWKYSGLLVLLPHGAGARALLSFVSLRSKFSDIVSPKPRFYEICFFMKRFHVISPKLF